MALVAVLAGTIPGAALTPPPGAGPGPSPAVPADAGYQIICVEPDLGFCTRMIDDAERREPRATVIDIDALGAVLTAFAVATGKPPDCRVLEASCAHTGAYPAPGLLVERVGEAGFTEVEVRKAVLTDPVPPGTELIGGVGQADGCVIVALGRDVSAYGTGRISATGRCLPG